MNDGKKIVRLLRVISTLLACIFVLQFWTCNHLKAQGFIEYDSLVTKLDGYGYVEYAVPMQGEVDSNGVPIDTMFFLVNVDSLTVDSTIAVDFYFFSPIKNIWISQILCARDTVSLFYTCIIIHIIPEWDPSWIKEVLIE